MAATNLTAAARHENQRALMLAAGVQPEEASQRLESVALLTVANNDPVAASLAKEIEAMMERTLSVAREINDPAAPFAVEIVIGLIPGRSGAPKVFASLDREGATIGPQPPDAPLVSVHPLLDLIVACYVCSAAIYRAVCHDMANPPPEVLRISYEDLGISANDLIGSFDIGAAYLAGAGAIGNGFLWAARHLDIHGTLNVVDDDDVSSGNLQRQIWFEVDDIEAPKATRLAEKAQPYFKNLKLVPRQILLQDVEERNADARWLRLLIVAVDSRMARRTLQKELPGQVFDASTTGVREIVVHSNRALSGLACMGCIYPKDDREVSQQESIAAHLGISLDDMSAERITTTIAAKIGRKFPDLRLDQWEGKAFDSLYKDLCSSQQLQTPEGQTVVAPFAFVSVLAGALLALEIVRTLRAHDPAGMPNDWRISPWHPPLPLKRRRRMRVADCECCGRPALQKIAEEVWGSAAA